MNFRHALFIAPMALITSGCYTFQGPERIITKDARPATLSQSNIKMFIDDFTKAHDFRNKNPSAINPYIPQMLRSGFMYNYSFCDNYFTKMGQNQRRSNIIRSMLPPITALITGIIGFQDFSKNPGAKENLIAALAIGSAASTAALNIYDEHFLFGVENIGSVQVMALKSLDAHANKVFEQKDISFERAMQHLIDNQGQCSPQAILSLARSVIKNAPLEARNENEDGKPPAPAPAGPAPVAPAGGPPLPPPAPPPAGKTPPAGKVTISPVV